MPDELKPTWLFIAPIIAFTVLAVSTFLIFLSLELHPLKLLGIQCLFAIAVGFGALFGHHLEYRDSASRLGIISFWSWFALIATMCGFSVVNFLTTPRTLPHGIAKSIPVVVFLFFFAFVLFALRRLLSAGGTSARILSNTLALWVTGIQWSCLWIAVTLLMLFIKQSSIAFWMTQIFAYWLLLHCAELFIRVAAGLIGNKTTGFERLPALFSYELLFHGRNPFVRLIDDLKEEYGIDLHSSRIGPFINTWLPRLVLALFIIYWGLTTLVVIKPHELGLRECLGVPGSRPVESGLHFKFPWPFEYVRTFPAKRLLSMTIGYEAMDQNQDMIWSRPHGRHEYRFPVGNAKELISVDAVLLYEIDDIFNYAYTTQNPDSLISALAYNTLLSEIVSKTLNELLSVDRFRLSNIVTETLNSRLEKEQIGLRAVLLSFLSIHPPFEVAASYQRVVSSGLAKEARILRAQAYREQKLPAAQTLADSLIAAARADSARRIGKAIGESNAFKTRSAARRSARTVIDQDLRLTALEKILHGEEYIIIDKQLSASSLQPWIDLRTIPASDVSADTLNTPMPWDGEGALE